MPYRGDEALTRLLDDELNFEPTTTEELSNHLPMALVAKWRLGANEEELRRFSGSYQPRLRLLSRPVIELDAVNWTSFIGQRGAGGDLRRYFSQAIENHGVDDVLHSHLPAMLPGIGGGAFHGVIRLSYALDASSPARIAAGLAYLAEVGDPLGALPDHIHGSMNVCEAAAALRTSDLLGDMPVGWNIGDRMRAAAHDERFQAVVGSVAIDNDTETQLAELALHLFASSGDFTALHGVTGMAAISSIRPWIHDQDALDRLSTQALLAAYVTIGSPLVWSQTRLDEFVGRNGSTLAEVASVGALSDDEHVSKLIYSAHARWSEVSDPLYLAIAARHAGLID